MYYMWAAGWKRDKKNLEEGLYYGLLLVESTYERLPKKHLHF